MKKLFKKYLTKKVRNIISIFIIVFGLVYIINYSFYKPTYINKFIAMNIYREPANNAFTDQNFYNCVIDAYNGNNNTDFEYTYELDDEQLKTITSLECNDSNISNVTGVEKLTFLKIFSVANNQITSLNIENNTEITRLSVGNNKLEELNLENNTKLTELYVFRNQLTMLDLSNNIELERINAEYNQLIDLNLENNNKLVELKISNNQLKNLNLSNLSMLKLLYVDNNELSNLNLENNILLENLYVDQNNLTNIDLSNNANIIYLGLSNNVLDKIDLSNQLSLRQFNVFNNELSNLNINNNISLISLNASGNKLTELNLTNNLELQYLYLYDNKLFELNLDYNSKLVGLHVENNDIVDLDLSNNPLLTIIRVYDNKLINLNINNNTKIIELDVHSNKLTNLDLSNNTLLNRLDLRDNKLTSLDLNNNNQITYLKLNNNDFGNKIIKYVGDSEKVTSMVILPSNLEQDITWNSSDESIAGSDSNGNITTKKVGTVNIVGTNKYYTTKTIINVFEMTSDKYMIDNKNLYISVGNDNDVDTIKNNINVPDYVASDIDLVNNKLKLVNKDEVIKEFKIIRINSNNYNIEDDYIYMRNNNDISGLSCYNCNASIEDNNVIIKYNDIEIDRFKLIKFSNKYNLYDNCIYTSKDNDEDIISNLEIINGNAIIDNNKLKIIYNNNLLDEFDILGFSTKYIILDNNALYTGFNEFNINGISYRGDKITGKYSDNKFTVLYNNSAKMGNYDVITLSGNNISISRKNIDTEEIDYDTFIDNLSVIDNISYKVIYNNEEVTSGDIPRNSILNIYYNNELIDKYYINRDYIFDIDDDISVLEEESIIYNINVGFTKNNLLDKVNTNGETFILDNNMKSIEDNNIIRTGYIFRTIFENDLDNPLDYKLSVKGDVLGTGELSRENAKEIAKHIIKKNVIKEKEYLLAADYNNDGKIKMNDVIKMLRDKKNKENS